jgi:hypothetical protein
MKILFISDIVGEPGRTAVKRIIPEMITANKAEFIIANGENAAGGKGITKAIAEELFGYGVNAITLGNHTWERKEIESIIDDPRVLRPANFAPGVPGKGWNLFNVAGGTIKICVINIIGRVYMRQADCPFRAMDAILASVKPHTNNIIVDFHTEITSEKQAMGWYLNTKVSAVIGTHTHVQTADERILPGDSTAYITDAGMCGARDGVIGVDKEIIIKRYLTGLPLKFSIATGPAIFNGCVIDIDTGTGKAISIERIQQ